MTAIEERRLKALLKSAVVEVLEERNDLLRDAVKESLEDVAMLRAIREGEKSKLVSRKKSFNGSRAPREYCFSRIVQRRPGGDH
jgi:hypothetical protein